MSKKWIVVIAAAVVLGVVACAGMGALRWGEMIYRRSDGQRGWSLGASVYQMFGWGAEAYEEDFGWAHVAEDAAEGMGEFEICLVDDDEDGTADHGVIEVPSGRGLRRRGHARFGRGFSHRGGGLLRLVFLALLIGGGVYFYRRWRNARSSASVSGE